MQTAYPVPTDEAKRLARLYALDVLDSAAEPLFDALTEAAALVADVPIALISLIDADRQWFKSSIGLPGARETPRDISFCTHTILGDDILEVPDARVDARFAASPLVTGKPEIRFYAGAPIVLADGLRMGSLCVIDRKPRALTESQRAILVQLARAAAEALEQRMLALQRQAAQVQAHAAERLRALDHERLDQIIAAMRAGTWEWNVETGELRCNERWSEIIGYAANELKPTSIEVWQAHADSEDWTRSRVLLDEHFRGDSDYYHAQMRLRHKDGHWVWVGSSGRVVARDQDGHPTLMYGAIVDITVSMEIEQRLRLSEALLDRTGRVAGVGGWELDLANNEVAWSDETCRIHDAPIGYRPTLEEGLSFYAPTARPVIQAAVEKAITESRGWDLELPFVTATGRNIWVRTVGTVELENGHPRWLIGAFQDTTVRRRAVHALEVSERRFRKLFEFSLGMICTHDLEGVVLSVNPAAAAALGYQVGQLMGHPLQALVPAERHAEFAAYLQRIVCNRSDSGELHLQARDGRRLIWQYHNMLDDEDEDSYVIGHAQDITERERYERTLREWSVRDPLTGLYNRRHLSDLAASMSEEDVWGCIAVDLDRFKQVNDVHGHQRGDEVLVEMGKFLARHVRPDDVVVRSGGDEFLMLLKGADDGMTDAVCARMREHHADAPIGFTLGRSVRRLGVPLQAALEAADQNLYEARARARG